MGYSVNMGLRENHSRKATDLSGNNRTQTDRSSRMATAVAVTPSHVLVFRRDFIWVSEIDKNAPSQVRTAVDGPRQTALAVRRRYPRVKPILSPRGGSIKG